MYLINVYYTDIDIFVNCN